MLAVVIVAVAAVRRNYVHFSLLGYIHGGSLDFVADAFHRILVFVGDESGMRNNLDSVDWDSRSLHIDRNILFDSSDTPFRFVESRCIDSFGSTDRMVADEQNILLLFGDCAVMLMVLFSECWLYVYH